MRRSTSRFRSSETDALPVGWFDGHLTVTFSRRENQATHKRTHIFKYVISRWDWLLPRTHKGETVNTSGLTDVEVEQPNSSRYMRGTVSQGAAGSSGADGGDGGGGGSSGAKGSGYSGYRVYGKPFVTEGNVDFVPYFSEDKAEVDVKLIDAPLGAPLAKNVKQIYGVDKATFVLQSASDDTMQFVDDCLEALNAGPGSRGGDALMAEVLEPVYLKKPKKNRYDDYDDDGGTGYNSMAWSGGGDFGIDFDDDAEPDAITSAGNAAVDGVTNDTKLEWLDRVKRARMFAQNKWGGAGEIVTVRDFMAFFKMCLEPIGKLADTQGLNDIQLDPQQLSVSWTYEDKAAQAAPDEDAALRAAADGMLGGSGGVGASGVRNEIKYGGVAKDDKKLRKTQEELDRELPLVTLMLNNGGAPKELNVQASAYGERA